ncbi:MAG: hypothetical protein GWP91_18945 [Rhodobacterales bacterium]|nr:hypothetical protein [Rhodobacterales bacterium]
MRHVLFTPVLVALLLAGCGDDDEKSSPMTKPTSTTSTTVPTTTTTSTTTTTTPAPWCTSTVPNCPISIIESYPSNLSTDVYYRTAIDFSFTLLDGTEDIRLSEAGVTVPGTANASITTGKLTFVPDAPLLPNTAYRVDTCSCLGVISSNWTTNDIGAPATAVDLVDRTYRADFGGGRIVEPAGIGALIGSLLEAEMLLGVTAADASAITLIGGTGDALGGQDTCVATAVYVENTDFTQNPYFATQSPEQLWNVAGLEVSLSDIEITGSFAADGSALLGATLESILDVSTLDTLLGADTCGLLPTFGLSCIPCPTGPATCLDIFVDSLDMPEVPGLVLEARTDIQIGDDLFCNP